MGLQPLEIEEGAEAFRVEVIPVMDEEDSLTHHPFVLPNNLPPSDVFSVAKHTPTRNTKEKHDDWSPMNKANGSTNCLETELYASHSTSAPSAAVEEPPVHTPTLAPFVATSTTVAQNKTPDDIFPIITKLKADTLEQALTDSGICEKYKDILVGLRQGFPCGLENFSLASTFIPPNHYTAKEDKEFIITKYAEEIKLGRISHGYN